MIALISIRLQSIVTLARTKLKAYTDLNDIHQQVILDLYRSHIALAETVQEMAKAMAVDEQAAEEIARGAEDTAKALVKLTSQVLQISEHLLAQHGIVLDDDTER